MSRGPGKLMLAIREEVVALGGKDMTSRELATAIFGEGFSEGEFRSVQRAMRTLPPEWGISVFKFGQGYGSGTTGVVLKAFLSTHTAADKASALRASLAS